MPRDLSLGRQVADGLAIATMPAPVGYGTFLRFLIALGGTEWRPIHLLRVCQGRGCGSVVRIFGRDSER